MFQPQAETELLELCLISRSGFSAIYCNQKSFFRTYLSKQLGKLFRDLLGQIGAMKAQSHLSFK